MAFSIRSFFGKDKPAESSPASVAGKSNSQVNLGAGMPANGVPQAPTQNPFAASMIFKTSQTSEAPGQPISSPFSTAAAAAPGLTVGDIMAQLPPDVARNPNLSPLTPVNLPDEVIDRAVRSGQGSLALFEVYRVCPALFQTPISPQDPRLVALSPQKIAQLIPGMKAHAPAAGSTNPFGGPSFPPPASSSPAAQAASPFSAAPQNGVSPFSPAAPTPAMASGNPFSPSPIGRPAGSEPGGAVPSPFAPAPQPHGDAAGAIPSPFAPAVSMTGTGALPQPPGATAQAPVNPFAAPESPPPAPQMQAGVPGSNPLPNPFAPAAPPASGPANNPFAPPASPFASAPLPAPAPAPVSEKPPETEQSSPFGSNPFSLPPQIPASPAAQSAPNPFAPPPTSSAPESASPFTFGAPLSASPSPFGAASAPPPQPPAEPAAPVSLGAPSFGFQPPAPATPAPVSAPASAPNPFERIQALSKAQEPAPPPAAQAPVTPPSIPATGFGFGPPPKEAPSGLPPGGHPFAQSFEKPLFPTAPSDAVETPQTSPLKNPFEPKNPFETPAPHTPPSSFEAPAFTPPPVQSPLLNTAAVTPPAPMFEPLLEPMKTPSAPAAPATGEKMKMSLAAALKNCPEEELGVHPDQIPSWVQVSFSVESIRSRLAVGKVVLPVSELISGLEPEYRNLVQVRPDLQIELPTNELFHALPKISAEPKAPAVPAAPVASFPSPAPLSEPPASFAPSFPPPVSPSATPASFAPSFPPPAAPTPPTPASATGFPFPLDTSMPVPAEDEDKYDPFAGLPSFPEWKAPVPPAPESAPAPAPAPSFPPLPQSKSEVFPKAPESSAQPHFPPLDFSRSAEAPSAQKPWPFATPEKSDEPALPDFGNHQPPHAPEDGPLPLIDDYTPPTLFPEEEEAHAAGDAGLTAFLSKMPGTRESDKRTPSAPASQSLITPAGSGHAAGSHRQLLLRVLFGVQEDLDADSVVRFTASQPGVLSVLCLLDGKVIASSGDGSMEAEQFARHASQIHQHLKPLVDLTGISGAETFSINSQQNVLTFSKQEGITLAVLHAPEERSLKEKITLIARELAGLIRDEA